MEFLKASYTLLLGMILVCFFGYFSYDSWKNVRVDWNRENAKKQEEVKGKESGEKKTVAKAGMAVFFAVASMMVFVISSSDIIAFIPNVVIRGWVKSIGMLLTICIPLAGGLTEKDKKKGES